MKIHVQVYDDNGMMIGEGDASISSSIKTNVTRQTTFKVASKHNQKTAIEFSLPERAFFKRYSASLSGPKQFVLMLAYLAHGQVGHEVALSEVKNHWGRMTSLLHNDFNPAFTNSAKESGWVDAKKRGFYVLQSIWKEILN